MPSDYPGYDKRRWYLIDCFTNRDQAIELARKHRRADSFGPNHVYRVTHSLASGKYCVEHASKGKD